MLKKKKVDDRLFETFVGSFVEIYTTSSITETVSASEGTVSQTSPFVVVGILLDKDDTYYYLGEDGGSVSAAVKIKDVIIMKEVRIKDQYDKLLDEVNPNRKNMN